MNNQEAYTGKKLRIALVGMLPPPPGGVSTSVASVLRVVGGLKGVAVEHYNWTSTWLLPITRPDLVHFNFSSPIKRLLGTLIGRLSGSKVVHTIHGDDFNFSGLANGATAQLSDGFILLNHRLFGTFRDRSRKELALLTPILEEPRCDKSKLESDIEAILELHAAQRIAVVYAYRREFRNDMEVYGFLFVAKLLPMLKEMGIHVLFLDPSSSYSYSELDPHGAGNVTHITKNVSFPNLIKACSLYLRTTSTDGNSVAILEALQAGIPVVASDCVPRPKAVNLYRWGDEESFISSVKASLQTSVVAAETPTLSTGAEYLGFMQKVCGKTKEI